MELLMKNIHMCRRAKQVEKQVVLEEDLNVPDAKPDVEMIIQSLFLCVKLCKHTSAVDVPNEQHRGIHELRHSHIYDIILL